MLTYSVRINAAVKQSSHELTATLLYLTNGIDVGSLNLLVMWNILILLFKENENIFFKQNIYLENNNKALLKDFYNRGSQRRRAKL